MFEVGDNLICVDDSEAKNSAPPLTKGAKYIANGFIEYCCGKIGVDVGIKWSIPPSHTKCSKCGAIHPKTDNISWYRAERFCKLEPPYKLVEISVKDELKEIIEPLTSIN